MIRLDRVTVTYPDQVAATLRDVDVAIPEGELVLVAGRTGSGKSTLLGLLNGLVPHFTGGHLQGSVTIAGTDTRRRAPRELAHLVGVVGQDPLAGFVTDTVEDELAYGMEQLGTPPGTMRTRVEETLDLLGIADLRRRPLRMLSGGQQQRVAIGSVLTSRPLVLVLDEPTSALDPTAAEEVLAAITRLVHDLGVTVVMAEHRMERVVQYADGMLLLPGDGHVLHGPPAALLADADSVPPVVRLGRLAGWTPLPLSVRDARRLAGPLHHRLATVPAPDRDPARRARDGATGGAAAGATAGARDDGAADGRAAVPAGDRRPALVAKRVTVHYGRLVAVREVSLSLYSGEVAALMGRNGSGKSSLLWALQGAGPRHSGSVDVDGADPRDLSAGEARQVVGLVPQTASDLLYLESVHDECAMADTESGAAPGAALTMLHRLTPGVDPAAHPRDLSEGQRLALVLAVQLAAAPRVLLLDEPTRGLDYRAKAVFADVVRELAADGHSVVVATHDVELVAELADRVVVMGEGEVVADGPAPGVLAGSTAFAPQVVRILGGPWLTVGDVERALAGVPT